MFVCDQSDNEFYFLSAKSVPLFVRCPLVGSGFAFDVYVFGLIPFSWMVLKANEEIPTFNSFFLFSWKEEYMIWFH